VGRVGECGQHLLGCRLAGMAHKVKHRHGTSASGLALLPPALALTAQDLSATCSSHTGSYPACSVCGLESWCVVSSGDAKAGITSRRWAKFLSLGMHPACFQPQLRGQSLTLEVPHQSTASKLYFDRTGPQRAMHAVLSSASGAVLPAGRRRRERVPTDWQG